MDAQRTVEATAKERWAVLKSLFDQAIAAGANEREVLVRETCARDSTLGRSLLALLKHHEAATSLLDGPILTQGRLDEMVLSGLRTFLPGELVAGRFRIQRFLAEGGMGEVYAAADLELNESVALKTVRPALASNDNVLARFKQEIYLARKVTHRNVSRVFDLFRHEINLDGGKRTIVFLSMELLEGETLADRIQRLGKFRPGDAEKLAAQFASGLEAAHMAGIIHGDLKPRNIALVRDAEAGERAVIMDFGLAATRAGLMDLGRAGPIGTPAYMAPEQVEGGIMTPATDIYAMGIVLFEMISGTVPFRSDSPLDTARLRLVSDPPRLRELVPGAPLSWARTIDSCLQRDPANRPTSAREVVVRLTGQFEHRRRKRTMVAGICALCLVGGMSYWSQQPHRPTAVARTVVDRARVKLKNNTAAGFRDGILDFRRATELDPKWPDPWAELAYAYATASNAGQVAPSVASAEARKAALQAISLDRHSAKALGVLGWVESLDFDEWPQAEATLRSALARNSSDPQIHYWLGVHLRKKGKFPEAEAEDLQARVLSHESDPLIWCELAFLYWTSERTDRMRDFMKELLLAHPNFGLTRFLNARLLKEEGNFDEALAELQFSERLQYPVTTVLAERASVQAYRGNTTEALEALRQLENAAKSGPVDGLLIAGVYAKLDRFDDAFDWLERGYARRDSTLLSVATSPVLKPLRRDPRFAALLRRLHFAVSEARPTMEQSPRIKSYTGLDSTFLPEQARRAIPSLPGQYTVGRVHAGSRYGEGPE